jgi:hypothetical protein
MAAKSMQLLVADDPQAALAAWRRRRLRHHATALVLSAGVLIAALALEVRNESEIVASGVDLAVPAACYWQRLLKTDCPGCGMTRSIVSMASGDVRAAWGFNAAGPLLFLVLLYQVPYRAVQCVRLAGGREELWHPAAGVFAWPVLALLVGQWIWRSFL